MRKLLLSPILLALFLSTAYANDPTKMHANFENGNLDIVVPSSLVPREKDEGCSSQQEAPGDKSVVLAALNIAADTYCSTLDLEHRTGIQLNGYSCEGGNPIFSFTCLSKPPQPSTAI